MAAKFVSSVLFVKDIQASRHFYEAILGQKVEMDFGVNVGYVGGFAIWQGEHAEQIIFGAQAGEGAYGAKNCELVFDVDDMDEMFARVTQANVPLVHPIVVQPWAQRVFRAYDPDGHVVEFGEPMPAVVRRLLAGGEPLEDIARRTGMPLEICQAIVQANP